MRLPYLVVLTLVVSVTSASAQAPSTAPTGPQATAPHAPIDATGQARGLEQRPTVEDGLARKLARAGLVIPKLIFAGVVFPVRAALYLDEEYLIRERAKRFFFNEDATFGLYPVALYETDFGLNAGARLVWRNARDRSEVLKIRASVGGRFSQLYALRASTGRRFDKTRFVLGLAVERRDRDQFFGIGNGDLSDVPVTDVDALTSDTSVETRFGQEVFRARVRGERELATGLEVRLAGSVERRTFEANDNVSRRGDPLLSDIYDTATVSNFDEGIRAVYGELELRYDNRRAGSSLQPQQIASRGGLAAVHAGIARGFDSDTSRYGRVGLDAEGFVNLYDDTRTLILRGVAETIIGDRDQVPFVAFPKLGGSHLLRGYAHDRFRDKAAFLGTAEYRFQLSRNAYAYTFIDAGKVSPRVADVVDGPLRVGLGGGFEVLSSTGFLGRLLLATSRDGGFVVTISVDGLYEPRSRIESH